MYRWCISHTRHSDLPLLYSNTDKEKKIISPARQNAKSVILLLKKIQRVKINLYT